jgi:hypothetical protein
MNTTSLGKRVRDESCPKNICHGASVVFGGWRVLMRSDNAEGEVALTNMFSIEIRLFTRRRHDAVNGNSLQL